MEPKFQSSFIPKGPISTSGGGSPNIAVKRSFGSGGLLGFIALLAFITSVALSIGAYGYKYYLKYSIVQMGESLEEARRTLDLETIGELTDLNNRIIAAQELITKHQVLTPLFEFLEVSTPKSIRFISLKYTSTAEGLVLELEGEARGYSALALQAELFNKSGHFSNPVFSDFSLDLEGDVNFSFRGLVDPNLVSYSREVESRGGTPTVEEEPVATSTGEVVPTTTN